MIFGITKVIGFFERYFSERVFKMSVVRNLIPGVGVGSRVRKCNNRKGNADAMAMKNSCIISSFISVVIMIDEFFVTRGNENFSLQSPPLLPV
jgi:hypothetical protein